MSMRIVVEKLEQERETFENLLTTLQGVEHKLYPLLSPLSRATVAERIRQNHTKAEIWQYVEHTRWNGEHVTLSWPKAALIDAYLAMTRCQLVRQREMLLRHICEVLDWDYACMTIIPEEEKEGN